jgi:hypothetical protein
MSSAKSDPTFWPFCEKLLHENLYKPGLIYAQHLCDTSSIHQIIPGHELLRDAYPVVLVEQSPLSSLKSRLPTPICFVHSPTINLPICSCVQSFDFWWWSEFSHFNNFVWVKLRICFECITTGVAHYTCTINDLVNTVVGMTMNP